VLAHPAIRSGRQLAAEKAGASRPVRRLPRQAIVGAVDMAIRAGAAILRNTWIAVREEQLTACEHLRIERLRAWDFDDGLVLVTSNGRVLTR
jgi:hypothetical protein